jgi:hypothetical protein
MARVAYSSNDVSDRIIKGKIVAMAPTRGSGYLLKFLALLFACQERFPYKECKKLRSQKGKARIRKRSEGMERGQDSHVGTVRIRTGADGNQDTRRNNAQFGELSHGRTPPAPQPQGARLEPRCVSRGFAFWTNAERN